MNVTFISDTAVEVLQTSRISPSPSPPPPLSSLDSPFPPLGTIVARTLSSASARILSVLHRRVSSHALVRMYLFRALRNNSNFSHVGKYCDVSHASSCSQLACFGSLRKRISFEKNRTKANRNRKRIGRESRTAHPLELGRMLQHVFGDQVQRQPVLQIHIAVPQCR